MVGLDAYGIWEGLERGIFLEEKKRVWKVAPQVQTAMRLGGLDLSLDYHRGEWSRWAQSTVDRFDYYLGMEVQQAPCKIVSVKDFTMTCDSSAW